MHRRPELDAASLEGMPLCQAFDPFHVEWERAAWAAAGDAAAEARAKRALILWKLHGVLAAWTGELPHHYEAALRRPELAAGRAALGKALARADRAGEASEHLRQALEDNPLDREAARAHFQILGTANDVEGRRRLAEDRRLLARAMPQVAPAEDWFAEPRPRGNELVSVILLCGDRPDAVRPCLDSLLHHTRPPYELILVDNGSADSAYASLGDVHRRAGSARVEVIRNETNLGMARGGNQGLAKARGRFLVFLDDDAVLTPGWLEGLVALALHDWPSAGLVGPTTNAAPPPQGIAVDYRELEELGGFAARRRRAWGGRMLTVNRLSNFCLLTRREVLERVGGLDERFALGLHAAADLCLRVREAGLRLLAARDVFVHRSGHRSPNGLTVEMRRELLDDFEILRAKWGTELAAAYQPEPEPVGRLPRPRRTGLFLRAPDPPPVRQAPPALRRRPSRPKTPRRAGPPCA